MIINQIVQGSGGATKYGATIGSVLGDVDANGVLQYPTGNGNVIFSGVEDLADYALAYKFYKGKITGLSFPDLTTVTGANSLRYCCVGCTALTTFSAPKLSVISGVVALGEALSGCTSLTSADLSALETISGNSACSSCFSGDSALTAIDLSKLKTLSGSSCMSSMFYATGIVSMTFDALTTLSDAPSVLNGCFGACKEITSLSFPALTTASFGSTYANQFNTMFDTLTATTSGNCTVHFPANLQTTISGLTGYPTFGGNAGRITLAFDLTATS